MSHLLRVAPWYDPEAIRAREARTERVRRMSVAVRTKDVEPILADAESKRVAQAVRNTVAAIRGGMG